MSPKIEWYHEFIDFQYTPLDSDLIVLYYFEPNEGIDPLDAIGRIASESSVGTWTTLQTLNDQIYEMRGRAFWREQNYVKVAYPLELWEMGNIPQLLSGIAGNIFGMKAVRNLRLIDAHLPFQFIEANVGPNLGTESIQQIMKRKEGPITATVPKPKIGMTTNQHTQIAEEAWLGGIDCIKDDENLTSQSFNKFELRVEKMAKIREQVQRKTGCIKEAFINVTHETREMERRIKLLHDYGFRYCMVDVVTCGFAALQTVRNLISDLNMAIHAHRAMHATFTKHDTHGISMYFLAKLLRLIGVDNLHIGTVVGKLDSPKKDVLAMRDLLLEEKVAEIPKTHLSQEWGNMKQTLPVASGGLHPGVIPEVLRIYGTKKMVLQVGGGIHGHPKGTHSGAKATIQAIESWQEGISLEEKAETHIELAEALEKWGHIKPV
ncbi:MAG: type III ribulose-bisphosphate carboxylase [Candidatus Ranarchaeia archaeon]|jgi:ribulose-bisphosphate carboxylase large chain